MKRLILPSMKVPEINFYKGAPHEMAFDSTTGYLRIFDGKTPGGNVIPLDLVSKGQFKSSLATKVNLSDSGITFCPLDDRRLVSPDFIDIEDHMNDPHTGHVTARKDGKWVGIDYPEVAYVPGRKEPLYRYGRAENFGEISSNEFIGAKELVGEVGLPTEKLNANYDGHWLKFFYSGKILFVPKTPILTGVSWQELYEAGVVYSTVSEPEGLNSPQVPQGKVVTINGLRYLVRLLDGWVGDMHSSTSVGFEGLDPNGGNLTHYSDTWTNTNSDWGRLMYGIHEPNFGDYPQSALYNDGDDMYSWIQDYNAQDQSHRVVAGYRDMAVVKSVNKDEALYAWRPALELIDKAPYEGGVYESQIRSNTDATLPVPNVSQNYIGANATWSLPDNRRMFIDKVELVNDGNDLPNYTSNYVGVDYFGSHGSNCKFILPTPHKSIYLFAHNHGGIGTVYFNTETCEWSPIQFKGQAHITDTTEALAVSGDRKTAVAITYWGFKVIIDLVALQREVRREMLIPVDFSKRDVLALNYDGSLLAGCFSDSDPADNLKIVDMETLQFVDGVPDIAVGRSLAFSPDGRFLAIAAGNDGSTMTWPALTVLDTTDWSIVHQVTDVTDADEINVNFTEDSQKLTFFVNDRNATTTSRQYNVGTWDFTDIGSLSEQTVQYEDKWDYFTFSRSGKWLWCSVRRFDDSHEYALYDVASGEKIPLTLPIYVRFPKRGFFTDDETTLNLLDDEQIFLSLDTETWTVNPNTLPTDPFLVKDGERTVSAAVSNNGNYVAKLTKYTDTLTIIDTSTLEALTLWSLVPNGTYMSMRMWFSPNDSFLAVEKAGGNELTVYQTSDWTQVFATSDTGRVFDICFTDDETALYIGHDASAAVSGQGLTGLDTTTWEELTDTPTVTSDVTSICLTPDGGQILIGRNLYNLSDWANVQQFLGMGIDNVGFTLDGKHALFSYDEHLYKYSVETGESEVQIGLDDFLPIASSPNGVEIPRKGNYILVGTDEPEVAFINKETFEVDFIARNRSASDRLASNDDGSAYVRYSYHLELIRRDDAYADRKPEYKLVVIDADDQVHVIDNELQLTKTGPNQRTVHPIDIDFAVKAFSLVCTDTVRTGNEVTGHVRGYVIDA